MVDSASEARATSGQPRGLLRYAPDLVADIVTFQRATYPDRDSALIEPRWRWMFEQSAWRLGVTPMVWIYRAASGVVAHQGAIAVQCRVGDETVLTGWFVDTMVHESHRGRVVGPMLVKGALDDVPFNISLGQTEQMRELQYRLGWQHVGVMQCWLLALDARTAFRGRIRNAALRSSLALASRSLYQLLRLPRTLRRTGSAYESARIDAFNSEHDTLWEAVRDQYGCAVVRDAAYLNWKYVAQPGVQFRKLQVRKGGIVKAICVWTMIGPDASHCYERGWILDVVVDHRDHAAVAALLDAVVRDVSAEGGAVLEFDLLSADLAPHLRRFGMIAGARTRHLLVSCQGRTDEFAAAAFAPAHWYLTRGDSDGDRPVSQAEPGLVDGVSRIEAVLEPDPRERS